MQHELNIRFASASDFGRVELTALWNRAYENYFVPIVFTETLFERHLRRASVDLTISTVLAIDGAPSGISLVGRREHRTYLAGFGIAAALRGRGLARALLEAQLSIVSNAGAREIVLEVIEQNSARALYRKAGFEERRSLAVLEGRLAEGRSPATAVELDAATLAAAHALCNASAHPTWRRELSTVQQALEAEGAKAVGVRRGGAITGYAVYIESGRNSTLLDAGALDDRTASELLDVLSHLLAGTTLRLVDEAVESAFFRAATTRGLVPGIRQVEMARALCAQSR